jgi:hypothetical protein
MTAAITSTTSLAMMPLALTVTSCATQCTRSYSTIWRKVESSFHQNIWLA